MASGLPVICSDIRGSRDLMGTSTTETATQNYCAGGIMIKHVNDAESYSHALQELLKSHSELKLLGKQNALRSQYFSIESVSNIMQHIYHQLLF